MSDRSIRSFLVLFQRVFRKSRVLQIGLILLLWVISSMVVQVLKIPIPPGILGMLIALVLLASRWISVFTFRRGAEWFIAEMMLFFVPALVAILDHPEFLGRLGVLLLGVIIISTIAVMITTALTVEAVYRWRARHER